MLSSQEIFDKVAVHLIKQGRPSKTLRDVPGPALCVYRDGKGGSCAVGCLIPDEKYDPDFDMADDSSVNAMLNSEAFCEALKAGGVDPESQAFLLAELQEFHDTMPDYKGQAMTAFLLDRLPEVARAHGLHDQALQQFKPQAGTQS